MERLRLKVYWVAGELQIFGAHGEDRSVGRGIRGPGRPKKTRGPGRPPVKKPGKRGRKPLFTPEQKRAIDRTVKKAVSNALRQMARAAAKM